MVRGETNKGQGSVKGKTSMRGGGTRVDRTGNHRRREKENSGQEESPHQKNDLSYRQIERVCCVHFRHYGGGKEKGSGRTSKSGHLHDCAPTRRGSRRGEIRKCLNILHYFVFSTL